MSDVLENGATGAAPEPDPSPRSQGGDPPAEAGDAAADPDAGAGTTGNGAAASARRRRRGTRGGRGRNRTRGATTPAEVDDDEPELPDRPIEGKVQSPEVAERVLVRRPQIGDTRPSRPPADATGHETAADGADGRTGHKRTSTKRKRPATA